MRLQDDIDFTTLTWVKGELDETLKQARHALEAFVEDPTDVSQMRFCATYLHQVQGTLRMVELYGAAMVTEEMERLATLLTGDQVGDRDEAYTVLMRGIVQLPDYLERLQSGHKDIPIVLLPLLNDLRAARGEKGLSESVLFSPDLSRDMPASARGPDAALDEQGLAKQVEQLRMQFQLSLLKWFRNEDPATHVARLAAVCDHLVGMVAQEDARRLFWIAAGLLAALRENAFAPEPPLKQAIGKVEREIKRLVDVGETGFRLDPPRELTRNLLYFAAHAPTQHGRVAELRRTFELEKLLPTEEELRHAQGSISGHNRALLDTVSAAIKEDLLRVKDALDLFMRMQSEDVGSLALQAEVLDRVADTLGMLGLGVPRGVVLEQRQIVQEVASGTRTADESTLLDIAGALLYVESSLDDQVAHLGTSSASRDASNADSRKVLDALIKEAQSNFAQAKQCFVAFVESNWDHAQLQDVPRLLDEVGGALRILELDEPPHYLAAIGRFTETELLNRHRVPNGQQLDTLADALASLEYYLEALREHRAGREKILDVARQRLEALGYWPIPEAGAEGVLDSVPTAPALGKESDKPAADALAAEEAPAAVAPVPVETGAAAPEPTEPTELTELTEQEPAVESPAEPIEAPAAAEDVSVAADAPAAEPSAGLGFQFASDEIDEEIRDVFIEEVQEEIDNLAQLFPKWRSNPEAFEQLKPIRRVFHTLKGSGRLVGALTLGEFSWKIENMLNRVLDQAVRPDAGVMEVIATAELALPQLLDALKGEGAITVNLEGVKQIADRICSGEPVSAAQVRQAASLAAAAPAVEAEAVEAEAVDAEAVEAEAVEAEAVEAEAVEAEAVEAEAVEAEAVEAEAVEAEAVEAEAVDAEAVDAEAVDAEAVDAEAVDAEAVDADAVEADAVEAEAFDGDALEELRATGTPFSIDSVLFDILKTEVAGHLETVDAYLLESKAEPQPVSDALLRAVHTMSGAFAMTEVPHITEVVGPLEAYIKRSIAHKHTPSPAGVELVGEAATAIRQLMRALEAEPPCAPQFHELSERLQALRDSLPETSGPLLPMHTEAEQDESDVALGEAESLAAATQGLEADAAVNTDLDLSSPFDPSEIERAVADLPQDLEADQPAAHTTEVEELTDLTDDAADVQAIEVESATADETPAELESERHEPESEIPAEPIDALSEEVSLLDADAESLEAAETEADEAIEAEFAELDLDETVAISDSPAVDAGDGDQPSAAEATADEAYEAQFEELSLEGYEEDEELGLDEGLELDFEVVGHEFDTENYQETTAEFAAPASEAEAQTGADEPAGSIDDHSEEASLVALLLADEPEQSESTEADAAAAEAAAAEAAAAEAAAAEAAAAEAAAAEAAAAEAAAAEAAAAEAAAAEAAAAEAAAAEAAAAEAAAAEAAAAEAAAAEAAAAEAAAAEAAAAEAAAAEAAAAEAAAEAEVEETKEVATAEASPITATVTDADPDPDEPLRLPDMDEELLDIFLEEGVDILDHSDGLLAKLREDPSDRELVVGIQRDLHTLKGGARMAGITPIGDLGHAAESLLEAVADGRRDLSGGGMEVLERVFDRLHGMVTRIGKRRALAMPNVLLGYLETLVRGEPLRLAETEAAAVPEPALSDSAGVTAKAEVEPAVPAKPAERVSPMVAKPTALDTAQEEDDSAVRAPQEQIRIRADLLDRLVNYAGEVAIYRARLEQQVGAFRGGLQEMDATTTRLREQLRRLEIETEAQIIARYQREQDAGEAQNFDPLELDRFSTLQQLSRALSESAADLTNLQGTLDDLTRQYETLLLQQSRVSSELQEGLMRTRMVPFDALVPRLRRILRQTGSELNKKAQLKVEGAQGEMDRNVLDRMTAPLEHMLRNALAHGLETPEQREAVGKPAEGMVRIHVMREASEVVIRVSDDGRGIDRDAIRQKAIERGLMTEDAQLSDRDLYGFILESGFSTAATVSKIAGRGVGMDVVHSEIKQLGGSLYIESEFGRGTEFVIRLPFTLAVTQAVFVKLGETHFAIPITSVQGVARIAPTDLEAQLATDEPHFEYAGERYAIYDMGHLLGHGQVKATESLQVPLLLARSGDLRAAICIDQVIGSKEIVVKPTGPQINSIPGIFGATVMGDGSVVVILDVAPLVRRAAALRMAGDGPHEAEVVEQRKIPLVMVVDDSITMRKVSSRVLERGGYEVITAKDGLDAIEKMQERVPDAMLLDIEMPRMDGYELATHMRNDVRLRTVPIIMITSRTGEKHRQRAFEIGVDRYLGKPYQEPELMRNVQEILKVGRGGAA